MKSPAVCLLALCAIATSSHAQNAAPPAAIVPVPFDGKSLAKVNTLGRSTASIRLQNVKPSQMASWLCGVSNGAPLGTLPRGIEQILPLDNTNTLLIRGRDGDVWELEQTIAVLDRPGHVLEPDYVVYWIDPNAPEAAHFRAEGFLRAQTQEDAAKLSVLMQRGDVQITKPPLQVVPMFLEVPEKTALSFEVLPPAPIGKLSIPNAADGKTFESPMPRFPANPHIDPDFQQLNPSLPIAPLPLIYSNPFIFKRGPAGFRFSNPDAPSGSISVRLYANKIWLTSAKSLNLKPPSPRLSLAIIQITPIIKTLPPLGLSDGNIRP